MDRRMEPDPKLPTTHKLLSATAPCSDQGSSSSPSSFSPFKIAPCTPCGCSSVRAEGEAKAEEAGGATEEGACTVARIG